MCFNVRNNIESATLWVAKKNIVCYKRLNDSLYSPYRGFEYKLDKLYKAKIGSLNRTLFSDAIKTKNGIILKNCYTNNRKIFSINRGLHSHSSLNSAKKMQSKYESIFKSIIPKGSEFYYDNVNKEYVSNQLIIKKLIK
jgi:hypothetical protein